MSSRHRILYERLLPMLGAIVTLVVMLFAVASQLRAETDDRPTSGTLILRDGSTARYVEALRLGTDIEAQVNGQIARVKVTQAFRNTGTGWAEASYVYPLPEDGAVDTLRMVVGNRVILGEIKKRAEAKDIYDVAKVEGMQTALVEQERPNVFTTSVANVGPGQTVMISLEYQAPIHMDGDDATLRLPLVVGPRYSPAADAAHDPVPDRHRISPPVLDPTSHGPINPVSITVHLRPGFPLSEVVSAYHKVTVAEAGDGRVIRLAGGEVPADRDFVLSWHSASPAPALGLFREMAAGETYLMASLTPPIGDQHRTTPPREMIFVIDNSGSMGGQSIRQAKQSLNYALAHLGPQDRFNVIRFDDTLTLLHPAPVEANAENIRSAMAYVDGLDAAGGTEMLPALKAALADPMPDDATRLRQIIFLTDGEISNEAELLAELGAHRGRSHVFMAGIGSAPNTFLMTRVAEVGRGSYTAIGSTAEVEDRMHALLDRLTSPVATELQIGFEGVEGELAPALLPDLYRGEPLVVAAKVSGLTGRLHISGRVDGKPWSRDIALADATDAVGVSKLWGKRRITDTEVARNLGKLSQEDADARIAALGLRYGLVTGQTSLVAVDHRPSRPASEPLRREELPINLPAGWDFDTLFGQVSLTSAPPQGRIGRPEQALALPQTATLAEVYLLGGLAMMLLGMSGLVALDGLHRRRVA